jgi:hypothetical protein
LAVTETSVVDGAEAEVVGAVMLVDGGATEVGAVVVSTRGVAVTEVLVVASVAVTSSEGTSEPPHDAKRTAVANATAPVER